MVKKKAEYTLSGRITNLQFKPVKGLTVHGYDKDLLSKDDILGEATTDNDGRYEIVFTSAQFKKGLEFLGPDVYIRVFHGNKLVGESTVQRNAGEQITVDMQVDVVVVPEKVEAEFSVRGAVRQSNGQLLRKSEAIVVTAYDQGLRDRALLGNSGLDATGGYQIGYERKDLLNPDRGSANLEIEVTGEDHVPLASSAITFNARRIEVINLSIDPDARKSEWDRLNSRLQVVLKSSDLTTLTDDDLEFIAKSEGLGLDHLKLAVSATRLAKESNLPIWFHYALARQKQPLNLNALLETTEANIFKALDAAQAANIIDALDKDELSRLRHDFAELQADHLLKKEMRAGGLSGQKIFTLAGLDREKQRALARALLGRNLRGLYGTINLPPDAGLDDREVASVRRALVLSDFAEHHEETVKELINGRFQNLRDLAKHFDVHDWNALVKRTVKDDEDLPDDTEGNTAAARRDAYARRLYIRAASAHPTVAVAYGLSRRKDLTDNRAAQLLPVIVETDDSFNLASTRLDGYLRDKKETLGLKDDDAVSQVTVELKKVQRLYRLKPEMGVVATLLEDKIDSAAAVVQLGRKKFVDKYGKDDAVGEETAKALYEQAEITTVHAFGFLTRFSPTINSTPLPAAIVECPAELKGTPNYSSLFGSLDGCECEPCESVYSPAAYLADLLVFLKREVVMIEDFFADPALGNSNGLEALATRSYCDRDSNLVTRQPRRKDIVGTLLSCPNAETEMPYVDLVLEILENAVRPRPENSVPQTRLTADQLAAQPQYHNESAYQALAEAIYPLSLPFDLAHEEQKLYMEKLGTGLAELLETFSPCPPANDPAASAPNEPCDLTEIRVWQEPKIAKALLGLNDATWSTIINQGTSPAAVSHAWGDPDPGWPKNADSFLTRTGLDYQDMLRLFGLSSFNPTGTIGIAEADLNKCDPKEIGLTGLSRRPLAYLHRFLRLQRSLGLTLREMDQALLSLSARSRNTGRSVIREEFLVRLSHLFRLRARFKLPLVELLAWWSRLDSRDYRVPQMPHETPLLSLYERLFLTSRKGEAEYDAFKLNSARSELAQSNQLLANNRPTIASALKLSLLDLDLLIADLNAAMTMNDRDQVVLNLANLSQLFRHASLARALYLTIADYLTLKRLIGFDPFKASKLGENDPLLNTTQTLRFVARADAIKDSGFSISELDYLLRQTMPFASPTPAPTQEWVEEKLDALKIAVTAITSTDVTPEGIAALLAARRAALVNGLAEPLKLSAAVCQILLEQLPLPADPAQKIGGALLAGLLTPDPSPAARVALVELLYLLHKASWVIDRVGITDRELKDHSLRSGYLTLSTKVGWLDLMRLPIRGANAAAQPPRDTDATQPFDAWWRTVKLFQVRDFLPQDQQEHFFELFAVAERHNPGVRPFAAVERLEYASRLSRLSNWPLEDLHALIGKFDIGELADGQGGGILQAPFPEWFADERLPIRILTAIQLLKRLGVSAFDLEGWLDLAPAQVPQSLRSRVDRIKNALKARYGDGWLSALKPLRDPLRERQRQALVTYLRHIWKLERPDDLFDHFLIDVEMSPCMMTSRLIQAVAAVQLFVQRVLMNLEPGMALTDDGAEQWEWMKNYRVWEANRKIFLYPENWIEPELRDDKTPFFKDLENELLQSDINNDTAETALIHYLEKLHDVSRLQVVGQYLERGERGGQLIRHVFARNRDVPHAYYYRKGIIEGAGIMGAYYGEVSSNGYWTPWERVDLDIEGDHLIPVVYNRRVYLFWPLFTSEDEPPFSQLQKELTTLIAQCAAVFQQMITLIADLINGVTDMGTMLQTTIRETIGNLASTLTEKLNTVISLLPDAPDLESMAGDAEGFFQDLGEGLDDLLGFLPNIALPAPQLFASTVMNPLDAVLATLNGIIAYAEKTLLALLPAKRLEVQLAWSEYKGDSWSAKKISSGAVSFRDVISSIFESLPELPGLGRHGVKRLFTFQAGVEGNNELIVHCNIALPSFVLKPPDGGENPVEWVAESVEIGLFRLNGCNGRLEPFDREEDIGFVDLLALGISEILTAANEMLEKLKSDRQLSQAGEPITPDDDPTNGRASLLRIELEAVPLPHHFYSDPLAPGQRIDDVYRILALHQDTDLFFKVREGFFYQDASRTFLCFMSESEWAMQSERPIFSFLPFYHPYSCVLLENIRRAGIPGIYEAHYVFSGGEARPSPVDFGAVLQIALKDEEFFEDEYSDTIAVDVSPNADPALRPIEEINFSTIGAYSQYNWEIFFHIPLLIATRLSTNQNFREAQHWFHYIFNPTDHSRGPAPGKYWRTRPFVEASQEDYNAKDIDALLRLLSDPANTSEVNEIERAVSRWRHDAFNPHLIARTRTVAFQKSVVMKYVDNLIAWGDSLFRQETRESVNEAMQLYVLAAKLLGPRPRRIPKSLKRPEKSFSDLEATLDSFSNALVDFENYLPASRSSLGVGMGRGRSDAMFNGGRLDKGSLMPGESAYRYLVQNPSLRKVTRPPGKAPEAQDDLYFCVPPNDKLLAKWDLVADRLFKIRHCQNVRGQALSLALLSPPIDPALLVRARAAGVSISDVLSQLQEPPPHYRFQVLAQKASEICAEVKSLGSALLSALEKRDGEELALLRNTHEIRVLEAVRAVKKQQVKEANLSLENLKHSQESATIKRDHYQRLLLEFMNPEEIAHGILSAISLILQAYSAGMKWGSVASSLVPNIKGGFVTTLGATYGGSNTGDAVSRASDAMGSIASTLSSVGGLISTFGTYHRRADDWLLQITLANKELEGLEKQIAAADIRIAIAEAEVENQQLQIEHSKETQDFMQQKFTNQELFDWMVAQTSSLFFQSYQMALEVARKAERSFALELGVDERGIVQAVHWDSLKKGLLAGEHLHQDLKRLEVAYLNENAREYELTKHVSLRQLDPLALLQLRATGSCSLEIPEVLFDMDCPGHYFRRLKTVALTIPCITGPYASVNCKLSLVNSGIRKQATLPDGVYSPQLADVSHTQSIVTSSAQNDSGLLETNLRDERYLPFENAGAISNWRLELPANPSQNGVRQFDYDTISDVVLHLRYTARDGRDLLRQTAITFLNDSIASGQAPRSSLFSVRHDFSADWSKFKTQPSPTAGKLFELNLELRNEHYPFWSQNRLNQIERMVLLAQTNQPEIEVYDTNEQSDEDTDKDVLGVSSYGSLLHKELANFALPASPIGKLTFFLSENAVDDLWIVVTWTGQ